ncbi:cohesin complex subunit psm1 [Thamnocephalis sphaerospora]|uniref:Structural maintenance of chromosomes protein n=1 Tax=Thamnocephalis sphaerospora TaxID=78915 RepID=A0A4P9XWE5_9FUNG|nr:cohesin complex subunit psm1 [Thamnocephalis sphaerospora]|eukprot:RKP09750.1 cohesin complex subunit psm1 [Thamnocephalis sphaerospora]
MGRLVCLEVEDFKSYRGRQVIGPFDTFTSVIGPNGAGKSNLMDAISFVLGVKSAQLRSTQLHELIYRGATAETVQNGAKRGRGQANATKPTACASVTAVYADDDGREVRLTRSVTSAGVSEYQIDEVHKTYAQYAKFLEERNVLVKARNFLVFQGDVESIASQSPKDLAKLIEQISGSGELCAEYEELKQQQERASENSAFSFNKRRGIAAEMKQFREQRAEAKRYERLERQKEETLVLRALWKLYHVERRFVDAEHQLDELSATLGARREEKSAADGVYADVRRAQAQAQREVLRMEQRLRRLRKGADGSKPALLKVEEMVRHLERKTGQLKDVADRIARDRDVQQRAVNALVLDLDGVNKASEAFEAEIRNQASKSGPVLDEQQLREYRRIKDECELQTASERQEIGALERQRVTEAEAEKHIASKLSEVEQQLIKLADEEAALTGQRDSLNAQTIHLMGDLDRAKEKLAAAAEERNGIIQREIEVNEKLNETLNRLMQASAAKRLSEREKRMDNCLRDMRRLFPGVYGRVVDLCRPSQRQYETAVSVALGKNMDAIVVDREATAIECIQYMREQRIGQATFLPLDTIQAPSINEKLRSLSQDTTTLTRTLCDSTYDVSLERAMQYVCGSTIVCDTLTTARKLCYDDGLKVKAVTLDGIVIHKSGLMTGGRTDTRSAAQRWEEREVEGEYDAAHPVTTLIPTGTFEAMKRARDSLVAQLKELGQERRQVASDEKIQAEVSGLEARLGYMREDMSATKRKLAAVQQQIENARQEMKQLQPRLEQIRSRLAAAAESIQARYPALHAVEDRLFAAFCASINVASIREYENGQLRMSQQANEKRLQFSVQRSKLENLQQLDAMEERARKTQDTLGAELHKLQSLHEEKESILRSEQDGLGELERTESELKACRENAAAHSETVSQARQNVTRLDRGVDEMAKLVMEKQSDLEKLGSERISTLRRCRLDEIQVPLVRGSLEDVPMEDAEAGENFGMEEMEVDEPSEHGLGGQGSLASMRSRDWPVEIDFGPLDDAARRRDDDQFGQNYEDRLTEVAAEVERIAPNLRALERLDGVENRLKETERDFERARKEAHEAKGRFLEVKQERHRRFMEAFGHVEGQIDQIYKDLTKSTAFPLGGTAYLSVENTEASTALGEHEPYLEGIRYHAMPPLKRFRDMDQLSGGEKTVAAFALLLAIHSYRPAPFFVMDEVDAALDNANVARIAAYIREQCVADRAQFIIISLNNTLYERAQSLVGIYRDQDTNSSRVLTLKLDEYEE